MSREDALGLASRALALLFAVWALGETSYLPERLHSFLHYINQEPGSSTAIQYLRHYYLITLAFLVTRIVGFSLMARWLYKGGPEVEGLLSRSTTQENAVQN
jgi:hypothetical protein